MIVLLILIILADEPRRLAVFGKLPKSIVIPNMDSQAEFILHVNSNDGK